MKALLLASLFALISCSGTDKTRLTSRQKVIEEFGPEVCLLGAIPADQHYLVRCADGSVWQVVPTWNRVEQKWVISYKAMIFPETVPMPAEQP